MTDRSEYQTNLHCYMKYLWKHVADKIWTALQLPNLFRYRSPFFPHLLSSRWHTLQDSHSIQQSMSLRRHSLCMTSLNEHSLMQVRVLQVNQQVFIRLNNHIIAHTSTFKLIINFGCSCTNRLKATITFSSNYNPSLISEIQLYVLHPFENRTLIHS